MDSPISGAPMTPRTRTRALQPPRVLGFKPSNPNPNPRPNTLTLTLTLTRHSHFWGIPRPRPMRRCRRLRQKICRRTDRSPVLCRGWGGRCVVWGVTLKPFYCNYCIHCIVGYCPHAPERPRDILPRHFPVHITSASEAPLHLVSISRDPGCRD